MNVGFFHNLPSGGAVRVAGQQIFNMQHRFRWSIRIPQGSAELKPSTDIRETVHPFREAQRLKGPRRLLAPLLLWRKLSHFEEICMDIAKGFSSDGAQCILVHNSMLIAAPPVLLHSSCPSVYFCHEYPRHIYERNIRKTGSLLGDLLVVPLLAREKRLDRSAAAAADILVTNSFFMAGKIEAVYGRTPVVSHPGIDIDFFSPGSAKRKGGFVLSVGALSPFKGHHLVAAAIGSLPERIRKDFIVVSDRKTGRYMEYLIREAGRWRVNLRILSGITDSRLRELYRNADVTVCASENEPYGLVPLEAMGCGCPVVAVEQGGFPENVRNGLTGITVPRTVEGIAHGITSAMGTIDFPPMEMIRNARDFVASEREMKSESDTIGMLIEKAAAKV